MASHGGAQATGAGSFALPAQAPRAGSGPREQEQRRTLLVATAATFLVLVAFTAPLSTLGSTARELGTGSSGQAWILSAMSVGLAATLLVSGAVADAHGRRKVFVAGAVLLALASGVGALAEHTLTLVLARGLQGVGGAALTSCSLGLISHAFAEPAQRARATGMWGASIGAGIAAGPLVAASLEAASGWRASYGVTAGLAALLAVVAARWLAESRATSPRPVDVVGASLLALGLSGLLGGLVEGRSGWMRPGLLGLLAFGAVALVAFVTSQARRPGALLDLALFGRADFVAATVAALANGLGIIGLMSFAPSLLTRALGHRPTTAALVLLAWSGVSVVSALGARRLPPALTARHQMILALAGVAVGQLALVGVHAGGGLVRLLPGLVLAGVASGVLNAALARQAVASVPAGSAAMGSGANNTARYVGAAFGVTLVVLLAGRSDAAAMLAGWTHAALLTAAFSGLGAVVVFFCRWPSPSPSPAVSTQRVP